MKSSPQIIQHIQIGILVFPSCLRSGAVMPQDVFAIANALMASRPAQQKLRFESRWVSAAGNPSESVKGLCFETSKVDAPRLDALMVPGIDLYSPHELTLLIPQLHAEQSVIDDFLQQERLLVASCSSAFLLAHTGRLDGRRITTSWWLSAYFRQKYPGVIIENDELIVQDGNMVSSGGVTSYVDLALWLVAHFGGEALRQMTAKILLVDANRESQAPYIASAMIQNQGHVVVERARRWINQHLEQTWTMTELAAHCNVSQRTLLRRFQESLALSPVQYQQQLRIERAKALLETTKLSVDAITSRCGYQDVSTFSKIFKRWTQVTPKEYRNRFGLRS